MLGANDLYLYIHIRLKLWPILCIHEEVRQCKHT